MMEMHKDKLSNFADILFRLGLGAVFFVNGISKLQNIEDVQFWMEDFGIPGILIYPSIIIEILAPIFLIFRFFDTLSIISLMIFCAITALIFHTNFSNPIELTAFLKNISIMSGLYFLLILSRNG